MFSSVHLENMFRRTAGRRRTPTTGGGAGSAGGYGSGGAGGYGAGGAGGTYTPTTHTQVTEVEGPISPTRVVTTTPGRSSPGTSSPAGHASRTLTLGSPSHHGAGTLPPVHETDALIVEGPLQRKHEAVAGGAKASDRSWVSLYAVVRGQRLLVYRDEKHFKSGGQTYHGEAGLDLRGAEAAPIEHHAKKFAFRVVLTDGTTYLFDTRNDDERGIWVETILTQSGEGSPEGRASTLPAEMSRKEGKRSSLPWRKK